MPTVEFITLFDPEANGGRGRHERILDAEAAEYDDQYVKRWAVEHRVYDTLAQQEAHDMVTSSLGLRRDVLGNYNQSAYNILLNQAVVLTLATEIRMNGEVVELTQDNLVKIDTSGDVCRTASYLMTKPIDRSRLKKALPPKANSAETTKTGSKKSSD
jgi:hypothetical protein